jgi:hypothetical protein
MGRSTSGRARVFLNDGAVDENNDRRRRRKPKWAEADAEFKIAARIKP